MTAWLSIVGIGEDGLGGLTPAARTLVETAEVLIGGKRHLAMVPESNAERRCWPTPLLDLVERIPAMRGRRVCVLATGDPMHFGIGATLATCVPSEETTIVPNLSAFSLAAARLQWPLESAALLTLHGRPVEKLALHVAPRARLLILSADRSTPTSVARWLVEHGFGESRMIALAHMGGAKEARHEATACTWKVAVADFHTLAVECMAGQNARWLPRIAGLEDARVPRGCTRQADAATRRAVVGCRRGLRLDRDRMDARCRRRPRDCA
jgi:precorrin-6B C5,15-methyltransferase / cobalt-precorrin-6B C5,C15-methyltransferase